MAFPGVRCETVRIIVACPSQQLHRGTQWLPCPPVTLAVAKTDMPGEGGGAVQPWGVLRAISLRVGGLMTVPGMRQEAAALATKVAGAAVPLLKPGGILFSYDCASLVNTLWLTADGQCVCMAGMHGLLSAMLGDCGMILCVLLRAGSEEAQGQLGMAVECLIAAMSAAPAVFRAHLKPLEDFAMSALMGQGSSTSARQSASHLLSLLPSVTGT